MPYIVVFDTCALEKNLNPKSTTWALFRDWRKAVGAQVYIPSPVRIEFTKHFRADQESRIDAIFKASFDEKRPALFSVFEEPEDKQRFKDDMKREVSARLDQEIEKFLSELFGVTPSFRGGPKLSHSEFMLKYYDKDRRPYGSKKNYQDSLVWETVLEIISGQDAKVIFISSNQNDFGKDSEEGKERRLYDDLADDLSSLLGKHTDFRERFEYHFSVQEMIEVKFASKGTIEPVEQFDYGSPDWKMLQARLFENTRAIRTQVTPFVVSRLMPQILPNETELSHGYVYLGTRMRGLVSASPIMLLEVCSVRRLNDLEKLLQIRACSVFKSFYEKDFQSPYSQEPTTTSKTEMLALEMNLSLLMNPAKNEVLGVECTAGKFVPTIGIDLEIDRVISTFDVGVKEGGRPRARRTGINPEDLKQLLEFIRVDTQDLQVETLEAWRGYAANCPKPILDCLFPEIEGPQIVT